MNLDALSSFDPYRHAARPAAPPEEASFSFDDLLDVVNPLQHLPGLGWIYREISGDEISAPAAIAGGALFGGPLGFAAAVLTAAFESIAGETPEQMVGRALSPAGRSQGLAAYRQAAALAES
jgi:hypothetical protein